MEDSPVEGDHTYVAAPEAVSVAEAPAQIVGEFTVTTGFGLTVTVDVVVPVHPDNVPVIVYTVVAVGVAVTLAPVVEESPVAGDQAYVVAPEAVSAAEAPAQIVGEFTVMTGFDETVTVEVAVPAQPEVVPVTV